MSYSSIEIINLIHSCYNDLKEVSGKKESNQLQLEVARNRLTTAIVIYLGDVCAEIKSAMSG